MEKADANRRFRALVFALLRGQLSQSEFDEELEALSPSFEGHGKLPHSDHPALTPESHQPSQNNP